MVANKTGAVSGSRNDVALIDPYGKHPLVLCILIKGLHGAGGASPPPADDGLYVAAKDSVAKFSQAFVAQHLQP
jgi:hypothetical protein